MSGNIALKTNNRFFHISNRYFLYAFLLFLTVISVLPFYTMIINATRDTVSIGQKISLVPGQYLIDNYNNAMSKVNLWYGLKNSLSITIPTVILSAYFCTMVAYGLVAFGKFYGHKLIFSLVILTLLIPPQLGIVGYYNMVAQVDMLDSFAPIILPAIGNASTVFFLKQYMEISINKELLEAANMDGASSWRIFHSIILPLSVPPIATMSIFNFVAAWNNYITPLILINDPDKYPLPLVVGSLRATAYSTDYGAIYLAIAFSVIPILIAFVFFARYIISGLNAGAVKG